MSHWTAKLNRIIQIIHEIRIYPPLVPTRCTRHGVNVYVGLYLLLLTMNFVIVENCIMKYNCFIF